MSSTGSRDQGYVSSPRPTYTGPARIPFDDVTRHVWGDEKSGEVTDYIYVSSEKIHQLVFELPVGRTFRHSPEFRTVFGADEVLYVLSGELVLVNPESGEVQRARVGEAVFFRKDTWHHAVSAGSETLRVLELFAPPPFTGTSGPYARTREYLDSCSYADDRLLGRWPAGAMGEPAIDRRLLVIREEDLLWRLEGEDALMLVGLLCSTEHLTVGLAMLRPGQKGPWQKHAGDKAGIVLAGRVGLRLSDGTGGGWLELSQGDGFYLPDGALHQFFSISDDPVKALFGVAPTYLA